MGNFPGTKRAKAAFQIRRFLKYASTLDLNCRHRRELLLLYSPRVLAELEAAKTVVASLGENSNSNRNCDDYRVVVAFAVEDVDSAFDNAPLLH